MIHVLTYATHKEGNFNNLVMNDYGIKITVLGWGDKWTGFRGKLLAVYKFVSKLNCDDLVIILDGFDVWINGTLQTVVNLFKLRKYKVLFSKELEWNIKILGKYLQDRVFPTTCSNNVTINMGLYMGYTKYLKLIFEKILQTDESDDQRAMNKICGGFDFISIDNNTEIFENIQNEQKITESKAIFVQLPGKPSISRYLRAWCEYIPYFKYEVLLIIIVWLLIYLYYRRR